MENKKGGSRWLVVVGALVVQLCLGAIYAWATFTPTLQAGKAELIATLMPKLLNLTPEDQADVKKAFSPLKSKVSDPRGAIISSIKGQMADYTDPVASTKAKIAKLTPPSPWFAFDDKMVKLTAKLAGFSAKPTTEVDKKRLEDGLAKLSDTAEVEKVKAAALVKIKALSEELSTIVSPENLSSVEVAVKGTGEEAAKADAILKAAGAEIKAGAKDTAEANKIIGEKKKEAKAKIASLEAKDAVFDPVKDASLIKASEIIKKVPDEVWKKNVFKFSADQAQYPFMAGLFFFALTMIFAGRWQDKAGPKVVAVTGGIVLAAGYLLGSFAGTGLAAMVICVGAIGGIGIGLGYVCPIAACVKWFPDKKGLITGLAVAGFGAGAYVFAKLGAALVNAHGVSHAFLALGILYGVCVVIGALILKNPPAGYKPAGWNPPAPAPGATVVTKCDYTQGEIVKLPTFWMTWAAFVFSAGCGLMVIGSLVAFGVNQGGLSAVVATSAVGLLALFNGLGRVVWGTIAQKIGPKWALVVMTLLQALMMFVLVGMGSEAGRLSLAACWIGFNFGGNFAIFPLITADFFGIKNLGANYGVMFTAYGIGGIMGPLLAGMIWVKLGSYQMAFIPAGVACLLSMLLGLLLKPPCPKEVTKA